MPSEGGILPSEGDMMLLNGSNLHSKGVLFFTLFSEVFWFKFFILSRF